MNTKELANLLTCTIPANLPVLIEGPMGLGKSEVIRQVNVRLDRVDAALYASTIDPVDASGLPMVLEVEGRKRYVRCLDDVLDGIVNATVPTTLRIEELGQATTSVQAALAPFFAPDRRLNGWTLSPHLSVVAATNSAHHRAGANPILTHIRSRVASTVHLQPALDPWLERAAQDGIDGAITSFLKYSPAMLYELELLPKSKLEERKLTYEKVFSSGEGYTNPRSWYRVDQLLKTGLDRTLYQETFAGTVGEVAATMFVSHLTHVRAKLDLHNIINGGKWKFPPASELALRWAFVFGLAAMAVKDTLDRLFEIAYDLHDQGQTEYAIVMAQQVVLADPGFLHTEAMRKFGRSELAKIVLATPRA